MKKGKSMKKALVLIFVLMLSISLCSCDDIWGGDFTTTTTNNHTDHVEVIDPYVWPTCQSTGLTQGKHCSVCGEIIEAQEVIEIVECDLGWKTVNPATKTENGERVYGCLYDCGNIIETEIIYAGSQNLEYGKNEDGTYYVKSVFGWDPDIVIPEKYKDEYITGIGSEALYGIESLTISSNLVYIDAKAFGEENPHLKSITVSTDNPVFSSLDGVLYSKDGKTLIKYPAGKDDVSFTIPNGVSVIGRGAFDKCRNLTEIIIPNGVKSIGDVAFQDCSLLVKIEFPETLQSLGGGAFRQCARLEEVIFPDNLTDIGPGVFQYCYRLSNVVLPKYLTYIPDNMFWECRVLKNIEIPETVTRIGSKSFIACGSIEEIVLPEGVISIGSCAFYSCGLKEINIPKTVVSIGDLAFYHCGNIKGIYVDADNKYYKTIDGSLYIKNPDTLLCYASGRIEKDFIVPDGVTIIANDAFFQSENLENIIISDSVTYIGPRAFENDFALKTVVIGKGITHIYQDTFKYCKSLSEITIMNNEIVIDSYVFTLCSNLKVINFNGTIDDWIAAVENSYLGSYTPDFTVYCTDGTITQSGMITYYEN